jgi:hypothetical protein
MNTHRVLKVRASLALPFVLCLILFCSQASLADDNPPARVARISYLKGRVSFQPAGQDQWSEATVNFTVTTGDRLYTDKGAMDIHPPKAIGARLSSNPPLPKYFRRRPADIRGLRLFPSLPEKVPRSCGQAILDEFCR